MVEREFHSATRSFHYQPASVLACSALHQIFSWAFTQVRQAKCRRPMALFISSASTEFSLFFGHISHLPFFIAICSFGWLSTAASTLAVADSMAKHNCKS